MADYDVVVVGAGNAALAAAVSAREQGATRLVQDTRGRVTGVVTRDGDGYGEITARGCIAGANAAGA